MLKKVSFVGLSLVLLALTASPAMAEASTYMEHVWYPLDLVLENPCTGEDVYMTGTLHWLVHITIDDTGGGHFQFHENHQNVVGVGLDTGTEYRIPWNENEILNVQLTNEQETYTYVVLPRFIDDGADENAVLQALFHVTVDANGELAVELYDVRLTCQS